MGYMTVHWSVGTGTVKKCKIDKKSKEKFTLLQKNVGCVSRQYLR